MTKYIINIEQRNGRLLSAIGIIEKDIYEREIGREIENNPYIKIMNKYPMELNIRLRVLLGAPVKVGPESVTESVIFTVPKNLEKCVRRMFDKIII